MAIGDQVRAADGVLKLEVHFGDEDRVEAAEELVRKSLEYV